MGKANPPIRFVGVNMKVILVHDDGCVESFDVCKVLDPTRTTEEIEVFEGREYDGFDDFVLSKDKTPIGTMRVYYP